MDVNVERLVAVIREDSKTLDEDYVGQRQEYLQSKVVELAVELADRIILEASEGSGQETNVLTYRVAQAFVQKVGNAFEAQWRAFKMEERMTKEKK